MFPGGFSNWIAELLFIVIVPVSSRLITEPLILPAELASKATGTFHATIMLGEKGLSGYVIQFKLPEDGPFVPHKDDHPVGPVLK